MTTGLTLSRVAVVCASSVFSGMLIAPGRCSSSYSSCGSTSTSCAPASRSSRSPSISTRLDMGDLHLASARWLHHDAAQDASLRLTDGCELDARQNFSQDDLHLERCECGSGAPPTSAAERNPRVRRRRGPVEPALGTELVGVRAVATAVALYERDRR